MPTDELDEFLTLVSGEQITRIWRCSRQRLSKISKAPQQCTWLLTNDTSIPQGHPCEVCKARTMQCICRPEYKMATCVRKPGVSCVRDHYD